VAEIIFRFPSKVPYGYVELRTTTDDNPTPEVLAQQYASDFLRYKEAEAAALAAGPKKVGKPEPDINQELSQEEAGNLIKHDLGATEVMDEAPWDNPPAAPTADPWADKSEPATPVADSDWDFG
jgi:hypothetical protein